MYEKLYEVAAVLAVVLLGLGYLVLRSWRGRKVSQGKLLPSLPAAFELSNATATNAHYVATTLHGEPLTRIVASGLAHRGLAELRYGTEGLIVDRRGEPTLFLKREAIESVGATNATIDRVVERDGLLVVTWHSGSSVFDTLLRVLNQDARNQIRSLFSAQATQKVG